jgi:hypothetical protein
MRSSADPLGLSFRHLDGHRDGLLGGLDVDLADDGANIGHYLLNGRRTSADTR